MAKSQIHKRRNFMNVSEERVRGTNIRRIADKARDKYPLIPKGWGMGRVSNGHGFYINHAGTRDLGQFDATDPVQRTEAECVSRRQVLQLMAGRCISATHVAASAGKSMGNCVATGHAAGLAAALSARKKCSPRDLPVAQLQAALRADEVDLNRGGDEQADLVNLRMNTISSTKRRLRFHNRYTLMSLPLASLTSFGR